MSPQTGGIYEAIYHLTRHLIRAGVTSEVIMPTEAQALGSLPGWLPVQASCHGKVMVRPLQWSPGFAKAVLATEADILHTHGIWQHPSFLALQWKSQSRRPHVASVHGMLEPWAWHHHAWKKRPIWWLWEKRNLESAALLHATSVQEAHALRQRGLSAPIAIIPHGVGLPAIPASRPETTDCRTALFLSRIHPKKGLPMLLEAWARVRPAGWRLRVVGPDKGGHREELERMATGLGIRDCIEFSGALQGAAKSAAFHQSELFILPTRSENFGIAIAEAMAHGLPVITTHGAPWQILETGRCGWWVPVSTDAIAAALDDATRRDASDLASIGARGRDIAKDQFCWDVVAGQFIDAYRWVLGTGAEPASIFKP
jgi:glycosyltransferase involved in cell wall biosynthesis